MSIRSRGVAALLGTAAATLALPSLLAAPAASAAAPAPGAGSEAHAAQLSVRRCGSSGRARCGRVVVPLDRSGALPGRLSLRVRILDPAGGGDGNGTIVALAGGPGQAATPLLEQIGKALGPVLRTRRIVTFDQRGTGGSGLLRCPELDRVRSEAQFDTAVGGCARRLGARRGAFTSAASVDDIEAVRRALGEERIAIFAVSYGTKVALDYAARYPEHVSRLVLDSVVSQSANDPFQRATLGAIPRVLRTLCGRRGCPYTRDASADVETLVRRMARGPLRGRWFDGNARPHTVSIDSDDLFGLLLAGDFDPQLRAATPAAVHAATRGDAAPLLRLTLGSSLNGGGGESGGDSDALYVATTCEDGGVPWPAGTPVDQRKAATDAAFATVPATALAPFDQRTLRRLGIDSCRAWPESPIAQPTPPLPDVPTLILSGDADLRTPRSDALSVAAQLPQARVLTVPGTGHSALSATAGRLHRCLQSAVATFFAGGRVRDCRGRAGRAAPMQPLAPRSLGGVSALRGLPPRAGRTFNAFLLTTNAMFGELFMAALNAPAGQAFGIGGLRGGSVRVGSRAIRVDRYSYVPGLTISGSLNVRSDDRAVLFHVGGRAAAHGTLRVGGEDISGTLGGRPVHVVFGRGSAASAETATAAAATADGAPEPASLWAPLARLRAALAGPRRGPLPGSLAPPVLSGLGGAR